jgi:hypothetical protein
MERLEQRVERGSREAIWQFRSNYKTADRLTTHSRVDDYMTNE